MRGVATLNLIPALFQFNCWNQKLRCSSHSDWHQLLPAVPWALMHWAKVQPRWRCLIWNLPPKLKTARPWGDTPCRSWTGQSIDLAMGTMSDPHLSPVSGHSENPNHPVQSPSQCSALQLRWCFLSNLGLSAVNRWQARWCTFVVLPMAAPPRMKTVFCPSNREWIFWS